MADCIVYIRVAKSVSQYYIRQWTTHRVESYHQRGGTQHRTFGMIRFSKLTWLLELSLVLTIFIYLFIIKIVQ